MSNDQEIVALLQRVNPVPDLEMAANHRDHLWAGVEAKRIPSAAKSPAPRRGRLALAIAAIAAVGFVSVAGAQLFSDAPPLDRVFETADGSTLTVYGADHGIPDGCAFRTDFTATGTPLVGGNCGIFELVDGQWRSVASEETAGGYSFFDMATDGEGGIWVGSSGQPLRRLYDGQVTEMEISSPWVVVATDGSIWAVDFDHSFDPSPLINYTDGSWHPIPQSGRAHRIAAGSDGQIWFLNHIGLAKVVDGAAESVDVGWPEGTLSEIATSPDGSVWLVAASNEVTYRLGVSDTVSYLVHYDGESIANIEIPFAEISDLAIGADGTVWTSSSLHGVFAYDGNDWTRYGETEGLPSNQVNSINVSPDGSIYATTQQGVARIQTAD